MRRRQDRLRGPALVWVGWLLMALALPGVSRAGSNGETLRVLEGIESSAELGLEVRINDGAHQEIPVGAPMVMYFRSKTEAYLVALYIQSNGEAALLFPGENVESARIPPGDLRSFPQPGDGFALEATPPLGFDVLFVLATPEPITRGDLGLGSGRAGPIVALDAETATRVAHRLAELARAREGPVATAGFGHTIVGPEQSRGLVNDPGVPDPDSLPVGEIPDPDSLRVPPQTEKGKEAR